MIALWSCAVPAPLATFVTAWFCWSFVLAVALSPPPALLHAAAPITAATQTPKNPNFMHYPPLRKADEQMRTPTQAFRAEGPSPIWGEGGARGAKRRGRVREW